MTERERLIEQIDTFCKEELGANFNKDILEQFTDYLLANKYKSLPCDIGDTVYTNCRMQGWYFREKDKPYEAKIVFIGLNGVDNFMNVDFGNGHMLQFPFSEIGKTVFLTKEAALKERDNK
jgi:hypothetical protein